MLVCPTHGTGPLSIGGNGVWGEWFDGAIDEVRVYDTGLTAAQVAADRDGTLARPAARLDQEGAGFKLRKVARKPRAKRRRVGRAKVLRGKRAQIRAPRKR